MGPSFESLFGHKQNEAKPPVGSFASEEKTFGSEHNQLIEQIDKDGEKINWMIETVSKNDPNAEEKRKQLLLNGWEFDSEGLKFWVYKKEEKVDDENQIAS